MKRHQVVVSVSTKADPTAIGSSSPMSGRGRRGRHSTRRGTRSRQCRICTAWVPCACSGPGDFTHGTPSVLVFEPGKRLSYAYVGSLPVTAHRADVTLVRQGVGTLITWRAAFGPTIPFTGGLLRVVMRKVLRDVGSSLAVAAEACSSTGSATR
jgi:hypothetical protein